MTLPFATLPGVAPLSPQDYQGRRILLETDVARALGISVGDLREVKRRYSECFPGSYSFVLSTWEVLHQWPEAADEEVLAETTAVFTETGAAMVAVLVRDRTTPERIATLLRAFQMPRIT